VGSTGAGAGTPSRAAAEDVFRREYGRVAAAIVARLGQASTTPAGDALDVAEDAVQEAMVAAVRVWPHTGPPDDPTAWLYSVAWRRALDRVRTARRRGQILRSHADGKISAAQEEILAPAATSSLDDELALLLLCCHPSLTPVSRVALTLKIAGGLGTRAIADALLVSERAVAQRLVRAKRRLREPGVPLGLPDGADQVERIDAALDALYLMFNDGYTTGESAGGSVLREAIRLVEVLVEHPIGRRPDALALTALMHLQAARLPARIVDGVFVPLEEQDRGLWDRRHIDRGLACLALSATGSQVSPFHLLAGIAAAHSVSPSFGATDWKRIESLYGSLEAVNPTPVVRLNAEVARLMAALHGEGSGTSPSDAEVASVRLSLRRLDALADEPSMAGYSPWHATRADLLRRLGRTDEAMRCLQAAMRSARSEPERLYYARQAATN
jgi:RNA polymerase sigma-70 factor (ECF subfamily)